MNILARIRSGALRFAGYLVPLVQSLPALGSWAGLMTLPFVTYLIAFFTNLPGSFADIFSAFFAPFPILIFERVFIMIGFFLLAYSIAYLRMKRNEGVVTSGPYGVVRHPQYLGMILSTLGLTSWSVWILNTTFGVGFLSASQTISVWFIELFAYLLLALVEERFLSRNYGELFDDYKRHVPFLIPFLKTYKKKFRRACLYHNSISSAVRSHLCPDLNLPTRGISSNIFPYNIPIFQVCVFTRAFVDA